MARDSPRPRYPREISQLSFFFTCFTNSDEAAEFVMQHDRGPGTFLLRPSTRSQNALTLTISINNNSARHVNVQHMEDLSSPTGERYFIIIERSFSSFQDLYSYYTDHVITNLEQIDNVRLLNPLDRAEVVDHSSVAMPENDAMPPIPPLPVKRPSMTLGPGSGLPEVPRAAKLGMSLDTALDSEGNENRTSSSSNGSGPGVGEPEGAVGGDGSMRNLHVARSLSQTAADNSTISPVPQISWSSGNLPINKEAIVVNFQNPPEHLPFTPADGNANFYLGPQQWSSPQGSPVPVPLPVLSPKEEKQQKKLMEKHFKKEEKQKKKEEKQRQEDERRRKKEEERKKQNQKVLSDLGWCRPPQPLPTPAIPQDDESPYYTTPRPYRNHLEELKNMLRESEICDCGLRMMDAELADGWTVHRSREQATFLRVFYQHENGNTTWVFPTSISHLISMRHAHFILRLCQEANIEEPAILRNRLTAQQRPEGYYPSRPLASGIPHTQSPRPPSTSDRSRSSSTSSGQNAGDPMGSFSASGSCSRNASLDQRLPMPPPN